MSASPWTKGLSRAVREAFVKLWEDGLLYRAQRLINWCPRCKTALADIEVIHEEARRPSLAYSLSVGGRSGAGA